MLWSCRCRSVPLADSSSSRASRDLPVEVIEPRVELRTEYQSFEAAELDAAAAAAGRLNRDNKDCAYEAGPDGGGGG